VVFHYEEALYQMHLYLYVSDNSGYHCVNLRKWFQPFDSAGDIKPTKKGVSLRLDE